MPVVRRTLLRMALHRAPCHLQPRHQGGHQGARSSLHQEGPTSCCSEDVPLPNGLQGQATSALWPVRDLRQLSCDITAEAINLAITWPSTELCSQQKRKVRNQKTPEEKLKTKEAKLKRATDLAAYQEAEDLLRADTEANHEWFVRTLLHCPLQKTPHSGPHTLCLLCRTKVAAMPSAAYNKASRASQYQASKKRKLEAVATLRGQTKLTC